MASEPSQRSIPDVIPVFPLEGAVMFPRVQMPLNIFEPRYLAMVRASLASHNLIGMIQPAASGQERPPLYTVGTIGEIVEHGETDDGRIIISLSGLSRFRLVEELVTTTPYRQVRIDISDFAADAQEPTFTTGVRPRILHSLRAYLDALQLNADWGAVELAGDEMLVNGMTMLCPFQATEKQMCLEAPTVDDRAEILISLMEFSIRARGGDGSTVRH